MILSSVSSKLYEPGFEFIKHFSCSPQLLINLKIARIDVIFRPEIFQVVYIYPAHKC